MKQLIILITLLLTSISANAADIFENRISAREAVSVSPNFENAVCKFSQERLMKTNNITLHSNGNFKFIKDQGVIFETTHPIQSTASYTSTNSKNAASVINAVSDKNFAYLEKNFDIYYTEASTNNWILALKPKANGQLKNELNFVQIFGTTKDETGTITTLIFDTKTTKTTINFKDCK